MQKNIEELIKKYSSAPKTIASKIKSLKAIEINFRPDIEDAWTIKEHLIHLTESELNFFLRVKFAIAEPGKDALVVDEHKWQKKFSLISESFSDYFELFKLLRKIISNLLNKTDKSKFDDFYLTHPKFGKFTLTKMIEIYSNHPYFHIEYIERNKKLFKESRKK